MRRLSKAFWPANKFVIVRAITIVGHLFSEKDYLLRDSRSRSRLMVSSRRQRFTDASFKAVSSMNPCFTRAHAANYVQRPILGLLATSIVDAMS